MPVALFHDGRCKGVVPHCDRPESMWHACLQECRTSALKSRPDASLRKRIRLWAMGRGSLVDGIRRLHRSNELLGVVTVDLAGRRIAQEVPDRADGLLSRLIGDGHEVSDPRVHVHDEQDSPFSVHAPRR